MLVLRPLAKAGARPGPTRGEREEDEGEGREEREERREERREGGEREEGEEGEETHSGHSSVIFSLQVNYSRFLVMDSFTRSVQANSLVSAVFGQFNVQWNSVIPCCNLMMINN